jgi:YhcH/YjgK/YiaL family protein
MIVDTIKNSALYISLSPLIQKGFNYLAETDFSIMEPGKYLIEGDSLFALLMEYETKDINECKLEAHKKYIDIQYMLYGSELMGVTPLTNQHPSKEYNADDDYALYDNTAASMIKVEPGYFTIFFPTDAHMPCLKINNQTEKVRKVVIKVKV